MSFRFEGLSIRRLAAHTIHAMGVNKQSVPPDLADALIPLNQDSRDLIQVRVTEALSHTSHGVEVAIQDSTDASFFQVAASMMRADDDQYLALSKALAWRLTNAQTHPKWPGGVLMAISGAVGAESKPFVAVIKAEADKGLNIEQNGGQISLQIVKKMLLSATQRLYKIGILVEITAAEAQPENGYNAELYRTFLFDHLLTATETKPAAAYFYRGFLGVDILSSAKHHTRVFFEETNNFIANLEVEDDRKIELREALRAELRSNEATLNPVDFAENHLQEGDRQDYLRHLHGKGFPEQAVVKDVEYIRSRLRRPRQMVFSSGVIVRIPSGEDVREMVSVDAQVDGYTTVKIKGTVEKRD